MINQSFDFPVLADAAAARYTILSNSTLQPPCISTHSLCCAEQSCSMTWPPSNPEPSPKLAPQQQMKSSPSAGSPQTFCSQAVLSQDDCSRGPFTAEAVLIVTTFSCSLPSSPLLCAWGSWYAGCCCAIRALRVCYKVKYLSLQGRCPFMI